MHIILRYEIERGLVDGSIKVRARAAARTAHGRM